MEKLKLYCKHPWVQRVAIIIGCIALVYAMIYADVVLRARSAYLQGEKYWAWHQQPALKQKALDEEYAVQKNDIERQLQKKKITQDEHDLKLETLSFAIDQRRKESAIKYAYVWYQTAVELFSPPESRWVRRSREKMLQAKELWKTELTQQGIPYEEYMIE